MNHVQLQAKLIKKGGRLKSRGRKLSLNHIKIDKIITISV